MICFSAVTTQKLPVISNAVGCGARSACLGRPLQYDSIVTGIMSISHNHYTRSFAFSPNCQMRAARFYKGATPSSFSSSSPSSSVFPPAPPPPHLLLCQLVVAVS